MICAIDLFGCRGCFSFQKHAPDDADTHDQLSSLRQYVKLKTIALLAIIVFA
jgi:hypothetical protein